MKRLLFCLALLLVTCGLAFLLVEAIFRVALLKPKIPGSDERFREKFLDLQPEHHDFGKSKDTYRILGIADSFGVVGATNNYHFLLRDQLQRDRPGLDLVNLSTSELEQLDELQLLKRFGVRFDPDLILHSICIGNDFRVPKGELVRYKGLSVRHRAGPASWRLKNWVAPRWISRYLESRGVEREKARLRKQGREVGLLGPSGLLRVEFGNLYVCDRQAIDPEVSWEYMGRIMEMFLHVADQIGATYCVVLHPGRYQVDEALREDIFETFELDPSRYDVDMPSRFLRELCEKRNVPCLDLLSPMREGRAQGGYYRLDDNHYNEAGNRLAADALASFLLPLLPVGEMP